MNENMRPEDRRRTKLKAAAFSLQHGAHVRSQALEETANWAAALQALIKDRAGAIVGALRGYTTRPYVQDEIARTVHLLGAISSDPSYFVGKVPRGAGVMPRNQLLYSLVYMGLVPSRFADTFALRPPESSRLYVCRLLESLDAALFAPNVTVVGGTYYEFIRQYARAADFVIFVGRSQTAKKVLNALTGQEVFLASGAGHNPILLLPDADLPKAVEEILTASLYNQGQDCSAPSAVLCPASMLDALLTNLSASLRNLVEEDRLRAIDERLIGRNNDARHVDLVAKWFAADRNRIFYGGRIDFHSGIVFPTVIVAPLEEGPRYREWFAPVIVIQPFSSEHQLRGYFGTRLYARQSMYVTVMSARQTSLEWLSDVHAPDTVLANESLHAHERGDRPYGGYGEEASYIVLGGSRFATPILPQRELHDLVVAPRLAANYKEFKKQFDESIGVRKMSSERQTEDSQIRTLRIGKLNIIRARGMEAYPAHSLRSVSNESLQHQFKELASDAKTSEVVTIAGRVLSMRNSGMFLDVFDGTAKVQVYSDLKQGTASMLEVLELIDLGDIIEVTGTVRRTKRGELTVNSDSIRLMTKALLPPPEKFHGLADIETRYRKRYLDLMGNEDSRQILLTRFKLVGAVRRYLNDNGFLEVETPMLQQVYGGASARPFTTHHNALSLDLFLRIAPELYLKRLLIGGLSDRIFELNRNFRNEGISSRHNPEFTMLEVYQAYSDSAGMMTLLEDMIRYALNTIRGTCTVTVGSRVVDFAEPFAKISMIESVSQAVGANFREADGDALRTAVSRAIGRDVDERAAWGDLVELSFETLVEPTLTRPTHVTDFPAAISPLAKRTSSDSRVADRFETFAFGMEIANAFSEMNDPIEQRSVFQRQVELARANGEFDKELDEEFLEALEYGMPPAGGLGVGIDRLAMIASGVESIREVIAFPTLRPAHKSPQER